MGLDGVELLLAVEEEFGVAIADADAIGLTTPALLAEYVSARLGDRARNAEVCTSSRAFYLLRQALMESGSTPRRQVRPDSPLADILGKDLRQRWRSLQKAAHLGHLPALVCRKWPCRQLVLLMPVLASLLLFAAWGKWQVALAAFPLFWFAGALLAERVADTLPAGLERVSDLLPYVSLPEDAGWTPEYVLQEVMQITSEQLGVQLAAFHPHSRFVQDLHMD